MKKNSQPSSPPTPGKVVQRLRKAYNLSLGELAEQSGVAKSIISQIERNETNPTLATIWRLSQALDTRIEDMLSDSGTDRPAFIEHARANATPLLISEDGLCQLRIIGWLNTVESVQWYWLEAKPGGILESEAHPPGSVENLSLICGSVDVTIGNETKHAKAGETLRYRGDTDHLIHNSGTEPAKAVMVNILKS